MEYLTLKKQTEYEPTGEELDRIGTDMGDVQEDTDTIEIIPEDDDEEESPTEEIPF